MVSESAAQDAASKGDLSALKQHPDAWPAQVKLKVPVKLIIQRNGVAAGSVVAPADSMVQLLSVDDTTLQIEVGSAQASVAPDETDLWERIAHAPAPAAATIPAVATATNAPPTPVTNAPAAAPPATLSDKPLTLDYDSPDGAGYKKAAFHFWSPAYSQSIRGIIIMVPGSDGDGRGMVDDPAWQALARKYRLALVGCFLQGGTYYDVRRGTGDALQHALGFFATQSSHAEVANVPLLLWGISAGGQFNYNYAVWKPDNVMAFVVNKGGYYNERVEPDSHSCAVPGLFILGVTDADYRINAITRIWKAGRDRGALWSLAPQPNSGHEFSKTDPLARIFFEAVLKLRLPDDNPLGGESSPMKPMAEDQGWLGNILTHEIHDDSTDAQPDRKAAWFPDESTAEAWKVFVNGG